MQVGDCLSPGDREAIGDSLEDVPEDVSSRRRALFMTGLVKCIARFS